MRVGPIPGLALLGGGTAFPARTLDNLQVLQHLDHGSAERMAFAARGIEQSLGVRERHWSHLPGTPFDHANEESTLTLCLAAAQRALVDAGIDASALSLILCSTSTPPRWTTSLAGHIGGALSARCACVDVRAGCAAGLFALSTAALYIAAGAGPVLLIGAETFSKIAPPSHKMTCLSVGDGAGALVLGRRDGACLHAASFETDGTLGGLVTTDGALPPTASEIDRGGYFLSGNADELQNVLPEKYEAALRAVLTDTNDIDVYVPHQTSRVLIEAVASRVGLSNTFVNVHKHANIGAAGWPVALLEARAEGRVRSGQRVALAAVGGGMSWAAAVWTC